MKKLLLLIIFSFSLFSYVFSGFEEQNPLKVVEGLKSKVQDTALDKVNGKGIKGTLENVKDNGLKGYIEWMGFIALSIAFILIIYNGIVILANFGGEDKLSKAKKRFLSLTLGVVIVTSGYFIIKLVASLIGDVFG